MSTTTTYVRTSARAAARRWTGRLLTAATLLAVAGCSQAGEGVDPLAGSVGPRGADAHAEEALLTLTELPDGWRQDPTGTGHDTDQGAGGSGVAITPTSCADAVAAVEKTNQLWEKAPTDVTSSWVTGADIGPNARLKEEIVASPAGDPGTFLAQVKAMARKCSQFTVAAGSATATGTMNTADLGQGARGLGIAQRVTDTNGQTQDQRYVYLVRGDVIAALTLTSTDGAVDDETFSSIVQAAAAKLDRTMD